LRGAAIAGRATDDDLATRRRRARFGLAGLDGSRTAGYTRDLRIELLKLRQQLLFLLAQVRQLLLPRFQLTAQGLELSFLLVDACSQVIQE
jgi:hypothetical protein